MSAALVAAKARDPDRVSSEALPTISYEEPQEAKLGARQGHANMIGEATVRSEAAGSSEGSAQDSLGSRQSYGKSPFQTSSLPPEILGLFNRTDRHSRTPSIQNQEV